MQYKQVQRKGVMNMYISQPAAQGSEKICYHLPILNWRTKE